MTQQSAQVDKNVGPQGIPGGPRTGMELLPLLQNCYLSKSVIITLQYVLVIVMTLYQLG